MTAFGKHCQLGKPVLDINIEKKKPVVAKNRFAMPISDIEIQAKISW
jgi:hypothetical protein